MRELIIIVIFATVILFASSQWAHILSKFFNSAIQMSGRMTPSEVTEDSMERFRKQVALLRVRYDKAEEERQQNAAKNNEFHQDFDALLAKRKRNLGELMQGVVRHEAQHHPPHPQHPHHPNGQGPVVLPPSPPELPDIKFRTQKIVSDATVDLRELMEQYDSLDEQRKILVENMKFNLNTAREQGRQATENYEAISQRLTDEAAENARNHLEKFEQLQMARQSFLNIRQNSESQLKDASRRVKEQLELLKQRSSLGSGDGLNQLNSWQDQRMSMIKQQLELNEQINRNARQLNDAMSSLESSMMKMAESRADVLKDRLTSSQDTSRQLQQQQQSLMENLQNSLDEQRMRNEQRMADMQERVQRLSEMNDATRQRIKEQMQDMKFKQAENKERIATQMQMIRDKIESQKR